MNADKITPSIALLTLILGSYGYIISISFKVEAAAQSIIEMKSDGKILSEMAGDIKVIRSDLDRIKHKLGEK